MIQQSNLVTKAKWMIWCVETEEEPRFVAYGSRKVNQLNLEAEYQYGEEFSLRNSYGKTLFLERGLDHISQWNLTGSMHGFTMVTGKTELEAICSLITAFKDEELRELKEANTVAERIAAQKLETKKEKKRHKKSEKARREGRFDDITCDDTCYLCDYNNPENSDCSCCLCDDDYWDDGYGFYGVDDGDELLR